jgi:hypothetical protein
MTKRINFLVALIIFLMAIAIFGQDMPHKVLERDCAECHGDTNWINIHFNHDLTRFRLEGKHLLVACSSCHQIANFRLANGECEACHLDIHQGKLAKDCQTCHTPQGWSVINATTAHANTSFPLLGAHARLDCKACHTGEIQGEFSILKSDCFDCHQNDPGFRNATIHGQIGASIRCEECHNLLSWMPANFAVHDQKYFPIYSGAHTGNWNSCTDCHREPGNFRSFECIFCHAHTQSRMDQGHGDVSGYQWVSARCYACHPRGQRGD